MQVILSPGIQLESKYQLFFQQKTIRRKKFGVKIRRTKPEIQGEMP